MSATGKTNTRMPLWTAFAAVLLGFAAGYVMVVLVEAVGHGFGSSLTNPTPAVNLISNFLFDLCFVGAALYFYFVVGRRMSLDFGYRRIPLGLALGGIAIAAVSYWVVSSIYAAIFSVHGSDKLPNDLGVTNHTAAAIAAAAFVCVCAPICEEFFFRGYLFGVLRGINVRVRSVQLGPWIASVIVAILFGLAHTGSAKSAYLIPLGFLGFVLCLLRWRTNSIYPGMVLHSLNNCLAFGVNEMSWGLLPILGLALGSLALMALITGPFSRSKGSRSGAPSAITIE